MRRILHLSDLHFGRIDPATLEPLRKSAERLQPHLVVVSGDLTQRARASQFRQARDYLATLPKPQLVVPGNHDVPLYDVASRFLRPLANYRHYITEDLEPWFKDDEMAVVGINTARSLTFKGGRVNEEQVARVRERLCALAAGVTGIVVTHHPFDLPEGRPSSDLVGRARMAMEAFVACGADLIVSGHLHVSHTTHTAIRYKIPGRSALLVQAGTATSTRERGEPNSFNALTVEPDSVAIERHLWRPEEKVFTPEAVELFRRAEEGWERASPKEEVGKESGKPARLG